MGESETATFILTHRLAGKADEQARADSRGALDSELEQIRKHADVKAGFGVDTPGHRRRVERVDAPVRWAAEHCDKLHADVVLEPRVLFWPHGEFASIGAGRRMASEVPVASRRSSVEVRVRAAGAALADAEIKCQYRDARGKLRMLEPTTTDAQGRAVLNCHDDWQVLAVAAYPAAEYWSICSRSPGRAVDFDCKPLPRNGPLGWWHRVMGVDRFRDDAGQGIRVGVLGTGVSPHPCLSHVMRVDDADDLTSHGTPVCGIIGARPVEQGQYGGLAPGAEIVARRVFERGDDGELIAPDQGHLVLAIDELVHPSGAGFQADLINMSLGSSHSIGLEDAVRHAHERGAVCVCSAGNSGSTVEYPAALGDTIGVSALGQWGSVPEDTATAYMMPDPTSQGDRFGAEGLYLPKFSCFGPEIACAAPGGGVISTVPPRPGFPAPYAVMDGTSLSSPAVCGVLALVLSASTAYRNLPRDGRRTDYALRLFREHCLDVGLAEVFQGAGLPSAQAKSARPTRSSRARKRELPRSDRKPGNTLT